MTIADCLQSKPEAELIDKYGIALFDDTLKGKKQTLLSTPSSALAEFEFQP